MTNFMLNNLLSRFFEPRMDDAMKIFIGENFGSQFEGTQLIAKKKAEHEISFIFINLVKFQ